MEAIVLIIILYFWFRSFSKIVRYGRGVFFLDFARVDRIFNEQSSGFPQISNWNSFWGKVIYYIFFLPITIGMTLIFIFLMYHIVLEINPLILLYIYLSLCFVHGLFISQKKNFKHIISAITASLLATPFFAKRLYHRFLRSEIEQMKKNCTFRQSEDEEAEERVKEEELHTINRLKNLTVQEFVQELTELREKLVDDDEIKRLDKYIKRVKNGKVKYLKNSE